jgi:tripartite-type tricarboxylate transporter receptor subunit TctC
MWHVSRRETDPGRPTKSWLRRAAIFHPPLQEGRIAGGDPGWGDSVAADSNSAVHVEAPSPPPGPLESGPTSPLQGEVKRVDRRNLSCWSEGRPHFTLLRRSSVLCLLGAAAAAAYAAPALAQNAADYPTRTVRIIVSSPPAGGPDIVARLLAERLAPRWGHPVVVENRPGVAGNLGAGEVAAAPPDGHTLLSAQPAPLTTNALLYRKLNFDPATLEPVIIMATLPNTLVVRRDFPANSVAELIAYAKAHPGAINYGSQGIGTTPHLTTELFARRTGTSMTHVPYRGTAQAVNDLVAGHLDLLFMQVDAVRGQYAAGGLKMLAVATAERLPTLPDVPTMAEAGVADFISGTWNAIAAPPRTGKPIVGKINAAMNELLRAEDIAGRLAALGMQPVGGSPADMAAFLREETRRWGEVIRAANISVD